MSERKAGSVRWRYWIWCKDCAGVDFEGCFGGQGELSEKTYPTPEAADEAADKRADCAPWNWEILPAAPPPREGKEQP